MSMVQFLLIALVSVVSGTLLIILGVRSLVILLDALGLHRSDPQTIEAEQPVPIQQAA
jgi:hypothetical protein